MAIQFKDNDGITRYASVRLVKYRIKDKQVIVSAQIAEMLQGGQYDFDDEVEIVVSMDEFVGDMLPAAYALLKAHFPKSKDV